MKSYLPRAFVLVICLWVVSRIAPSIPLPFLLLVFIAYALIATLGALYFTTIKRIHREYELKKGGKLSQINRKWPLRMAFFFLVSLVSAFLFVVESPRWEVLEWVLTFLAVPLYYVAYRATEYGLRNELDKKFLKARAIKISFWIVGICLCLLYAVLATIFSTTDAGSLQEAFDRTPQLFEDSPSVVLREIDLFSSLFQGVVSYLVAETETQFFFVGFVYHLVVYAFVFFGLVNQFGLCLLTKQEVKGEFQLLPANYENRDEQPVLVRYIVILVAMSVILSGAFLFLEYKAVQIRETGEMERIEKTVRSTISEFLYQIDTAYALDLEISAIREERNAEIEPLINAYYDRCKSNVDAYLDWLGSLEGGFVSVFKWVPITKVPETAEDKFLEEMNRDNDATQIQDVYSHYRTELEELANDYEASRDKIDLDGVLRSTHPVQRESEGALDLWSPISSDKGYELAKDVLLNGQNLDREQMKDKIIDLIDQSKANVLEMLSIG